MESQATLKCEPPAIKIKKEVKEEPEYIYVDETVCRVKLEECDEEVILPKDDMMLGLEAAQSGLPSTQRQPARRGRKPRILGNRGNTHTCPTAGRKILPRPVPIHVPLTLSHLQPPPPRLSLPPPARNKSPQTPVMVRPAFQPSAPTNSGHKILPWSYQLTQASLTPVSEQQKLQPVNSSLSSCSPSNGQALPLTHLQPISPGGTKRLMALQPLSMTQLKSCTPSRCIGQLGIPLSPQKITVPPKGSRKTVSSLSQLSAGSPASCIRVPPLPLSEATAKKSSPSPSMQVTTINHARKLLPRPLKPAVKPATTAIIHHQQQQQGALTTLQQLHPVPSVNGQQAVALQQLQSLTPSTTQATNYGLKTLNVSGQTPPLSGSSQMVSIQHVQALAVSPPESSQTVKPSESLHRSCHLHTVASNTSSKRLTFQQIQQAPCISVSQAVAIHSLPVVASSTPHQQATTLCQVHTLQSSTGHTQSSQGTSLQTIPTLGSASQKVTPVHQYSCHASGDMHTIPKLSPLGTKTPLAQVCSTFCAPQSSAPSQAESLNTEQESLTFHELNSANHTMREASTLYLDSNQGQDIGSLHVAPRQSIATVTSGISVGATSNGKVLKVPIQRLRSTVSYCKVKRKYQRRKPRELKGTKKKGLAEILPRPCSSPLIGSRVQPVTTHSPSGWFVPQVGQGHVTVVTSLGSSSVVTLTHTDTSLSESQLLTQSLPHTRPLAHSNINNEVTDKDSIEESFLHPDSSAKAVAICSFAPNDKEINIINEGINCDMSQKMKSPEVSQMTDDKGTNSVSDQHNLKCEECCFISQVKVHCPDKQLSNLDDKSVLNQEGDSKLPLKDDMDVSGDNELDHFTTQVTPCRNIHNELMSLDTSMSGFQDQLNIQDTTEDNTQYHLTSQDAQENSIQDALKDKLQDEHILQSTSGDSIENQCTSHDESGDRMKNIHNSQDIILRQVPHNSSIPHDDQEENGYHQSTENNNAVNTILDDPSSQDTEEDNINAIDTFNPQQSSISPVVLEPLIIPASLEEQQNLREENDNQTSQGSRSSSNNFPHQSSIPVNEEVAYSSSCPQSKLCKDSFFTPPEATTVDTNSHITQEQNVACPLTESPPASASDISQEKNLEPPITLPDMEGSLAISTVSTSISPCTALPMTSTAFPKSLFPQNQDHSAVESSTSHLDGCRVITATTTALTPTATTVTITTTTTDVSTVTTHSQLITKHACGETEVNQHSSSLSSQEKMDSSLKKVLTNSHFSEPKCSQPLLLVKQEICSSECQAPTEDQRKTLRKLRQQHRATKESRLRALLRAQKRTIHMLSYKLQCEQRRSKALWETLRRNMASTINSRGEVCCKGSGIIKSEEEGEIQPNPSPITRSNYKSRQVAASTFSNFRLKRKHKNKSTEVLKKLVPLNHHEDDVDGPQVQDIHMPIQTAEKTELESLVYEFIMRDDVSRSTRHGNRHSLHYLPLLHKRFMADYCQPCSLETFQQHLPPQMTQRVGEELETCLCLTCQNPELKVESLVRQQLLPSNIRLEEVAFSPEDTFKEFLACVQALRAHPSSQLSYSEWFMDVGVSSCPSLPQKRTLTRPIKEVAGLLEEELDGLRLHLTRATQQYESTFKAKNEAEQSPQHAVLQAEWSPLIILHALGIDGTPALQEVVCLQCGYLWSHTDSLGFIALSSCRDQRAAAVCASLEPLLSRLIQQGVQHLTLLVDSKTDLSAVLEYTRRHDLEVHWVFSEPGHGAGVAEAVGNSVTKLICDTVNSWGSETVLSAKDVFNLISPNSSNLVYYYSEEDVWRHSQLLLDSSDSTKTVNKLIKPKTLLSL